ncbi:nucleotide exchange factor GrpE [bacterium]|nr:nucleotide exchange factor GrpE [bacterium]
MFNENETNGNNPFSEENEEMKEEVTTETPEETTEEVSKEALEETPASNEDKLKAELEDLNNKYLRLMADFDNFRKRQAQERESLLKYGCCDILKKILPVLDNIERGRKSCESIEDPKTLKDSFEVIIKNLTDTLEKCGLERICTDNCTFNPEFHEAIMRTPTAEKNEDEIIAELQTGYKFKDTVLRPSLVNVASAPEEENN